MKFKILLFLFTFGIQFVFAQEKITETEKLVATAKIWGFLKYYHPEVAKGTYNWDKQLFDILPKVEQVQNKHELSQLFYNWVVSLGTVKTCTRCKLDPKKEYFNKNFDLSWTQNKTLFSEDLSEKLKFIEENRFQGKNHYVTSHSTGNIKITNEPEYKDFDWKNKNLRLLALFKYWNIVEYFFPYKYQTDQKWDSVLETMIPKFSNPQSEEEYHLAMLELVNKINDSHGVFITKVTNNYFGYKWFPADFKIINQKAIITRLYNDSLAKINDIRIGDVITKVDGKTIQEILFEKQDYIQGSNPAVKLRNTYYSVFNGNTDTVTLEYIRNGKKGIKTSARYFHKDLKYQYSQGDTKWKILEGNIGYVNMGNVFLKEVPKMMEELKNTKAIIFDIRNYPNGTMYYISRYIIPSKTDFVKFTMPDLNYPGKYYWKNGDKCGKDGGEKYSGNIVLLVNEETQSHAEFTAMCLQKANNVKIVGSQTAGADGNVSNIEFVGGFKTFISGIGVYYPDGRETQRIGIVPDVTIQPTIEGIQNNKDEVLEKAIEVINNP